MNRTSKRGRRVHINAGALQQSDAQGGADELTLNLFDDVQLRARRNRLEATRSGGWVWKGRLLDVPGEATFAIQDGVVAGTVFAGDKVYEVVFAGADEHQVNEIDQSEFPTDDPQADVAPMEPDPQAEAMDAAVAAQVAGDAASQIDVMVIWTPAARAAAGGTSAIQSQIDLSVANANSSYANSAVTQRLRLVYAGELSYTESTTSTDLNRLATPNDGYLDSVATLRATYGADVVTLLGAGYVNAGTCGIGYLMTAVSTGFASNAFNVVDWTCAASNLSYAHELGHNMGLQHDPANSSGSASYSYAYGYQHPTGAFRTVMAYPCPSGSCPRLMYFANPSVSYSGMPTGTASQNTTLALNNTASTVANFRQAVTGSCTYSLNGTSTSVGSGTATSSVSVTSGGGCAWTATSNASWLTITSGASGSGNGTTGFSVAANTTGTPRSGTLTIAGQTYTVNQAAAVCGVFVISPVSQSNVASTGASLSVSVTGTAGCAYGATSNAGWITVTSGASGTGAGTVGLTVAANAAGAARTGTVTVAGQTFTVNQIAAACGVFVISPVSQSNVSSSGASLSVAVTGTAGCAYGATSNASWITVTSGASGTGGGTVGLSVAANAAGTARTGTVTVAGQTFTVNQLSAACGTFSISPASQANVAAAGASLSVAVTGTAGCAFGATSNTSWITVTAGATGTGSGAVSLSVAANPLGMTRTGSVTIAGQIFGVTQAAAACSYALSAATGSAPVAGSSGTVGVTATVGCAWSASSNVSWITVTSGATGTGNGTTGYTVAANLTATTRSGVITIAGRTLTITQAAAACAYSWSPTSASVPNGGATGSAALTTVTGCTASATSSAAWLTVTGGAAGSASRTVTYAVAANTGNARSATINVGGQAFTINQAKRPTGTPANKAKADFNGDSMADLLWQHDNGAVGLWKMNGISVSQMVMLSPGQVDPVWKMVGSGDLNGDGKPEIIWQHQAGGWLLAWFMNGEAVQQAVFLTPNKVVSTAWRIVAITDINGDARADLILQHDQGALQVWYMNGTTRIGSESLNPAAVDGNDWKIVGADDVNGDLKPDLIWQQSSTGVIGAWLMNGATATSFVLMTPGQVDPAWHIRGVVDLDNDGKTDLIWQHDNGALGVWLMAGTTATSILPISPSSVPAGWRLVGPR